jgi:hypothetical protein
MSHVAISKADIFRVRLSCCRRDRSWTGNRNSGAMRRPIAAATLKLGDRAVVLGGDRRRSHHSGLADHIPDDYGL